MQEIILSVVKKDDAVFYVPKSKLTTFPCVFFKPAGLENSFETNRENKGVYSFLLIVMVGAAGTTIESAFGEKLPQTVDSIVAKINETWDGGTIDGHRTMVKINNAGAWEISEEEDGLVAYAPINVDITLLTSN